MRSFRSILFSFTLVLIVASSISATDMEIEYKNGSSKILQEITIDHGSTLVDWSFGASGRGRRPVEWISIFINDEATKIPISEVKEIVFHGIEDTHRPYGMMWAVSILTKDSRQVDGYIWNITVQGTNAFGSTDDIHMFAHDRSAGNYSRIIMDPEFKKEPESTDKVCPKCGKIFDRFDYNYCPFDGSALKKGQ